MDAVSDYLLTGKRERDYFIQPFEVFQFHFSVVTEEHRKSILGWWVGLFYTTSKVKKKLEIFLLSHHQQ